MNKDIYIRKVILSRKFLLSWMLFVMLNSIILFLTGFTLKDLVIFNFMLIFQEAGHFSTGLFIFSVVVSSITIIVLISRVYVYLIEPVFRVWTGDDKWD